MDLGAGRRGVDMGPSAIRVAGLNERIAALGHEVSDWGDIEADIPERIPVGDPKLRFVEAVLAINYEVADWVGETVVAGAMPVVLGGDHSLSIGSVAGCAIHFAQRNESIGAVWIDAHGDVNTPQTTPSGNIHGMSLAALLGAGDPRLADFLQPGRKIAAENVALVGVRDLDPGEGEFLRRNGVTVLSMREIDERGMHAVMEHAIQVASRGTTGIYVQFDMDVLDPTHAPGTGTPVPGGLTYRESHLAMEMLADTGRVIALDVVETNPALDIRNQTANLATELILSILGKRIYARD